MTLQVEPAREKHCCCVHCNQWPDGYFISRRCPQSRTCPIDGCDAGYTEIGEQDAQP